jgi:hypothetical protein
MQSAPAIGKFVEITSIHLNKSSLQTAAALAMIVPLFIGDRHAPFPRYFDVQSVRARL